MSGVDLPHLSLTGGTLTSALRGSSLEQTLLTFLPRQRWFGAKDSTITGVTLEALGELEAGIHALAVADVALGEGEVQRYFMPLSAAWGESAAPVLATFNSGDRDGVLVDSALEPSLAQALLDAMLVGKRLDGPTGTVVFTANRSLAAIAEPGTPRALGAEQSNISIAFGSSIILKLYRRLRSGEQPDVEVARFLTDVGHYANSPEFLGEVQLQPADGDATTLAAAFAFVPDRGDAWSVVTEALYEDLSTGSGDAPFLPAAAVGALLGQRTAEMHKALAVATTDPDFAVEPLTREQLSIWTREAAEEANGLLDRLQQGLAGLPTQAAEIARTVLGKRHQLIERITAAASLAPSGGASRIHGDYHLGQVLATADDFMIIDFEGEPRRSLAERRAKSSPLRDVAGMLRSFDYAAWTAVNRCGGDAGARSRALAWRQQVSDDFVAAYEQHIAGASSYPTDPVFAAALADLFLIQKALYEVGYELANRPDWVEIPLSGIRDLLAAGPKGEVI